MNWWEETEARAHRAKTPALLAQSLAQRLTSAGVEPDFAAVSTYDLAHLWALTADFIKLVDALLLVADGDRQRMYRQAMSIGRWAAYASTWTASSAAPFNQLMNNLNLSGEQLANRELAFDEPETGAPEEASKSAGRYQHWHLLYERLDLKLASVGVEERAQRALARSIARIYEQAVITHRLIGALERQSESRFGQVARMLLEINTTWHFDLGPNHLGYGELRPSPSRPGLQSWLLLAFAP
jgi:hypothetical protein